MSSSSNQNQWYLNGEVPAPPPVPMPQFATSPSPLPWRAAGPFYSFPNAANNLSSVGAPPPGPPPQLTNGANPPYCRPLLPVSVVLKRILSEKITHADSEVVSYHKEPCGPGRSKVTVTFETSDGA